MHLLFVDLGVQNVLEQNQLVEVNSEVVASDHHSHLALDDRRGLCVGRVREVEIIDVVFFVVVLAFALGVLIGDVFLEDVSIVVAFVLGWGVGFGVVIDVFHGDDSGVWLRHRRLFRSEIFLRRSRVRISCKVIDLGLHLGHNFV